MSTSSITSHQDSSLSRFRHQIPNMIPTQLSVSTDEEEIKRKLLQLQSDIDPGSELDFGKQLNSDDAIKIAHNIITSKAFIQDLQQYIKQELFPLPSSRSRRVLDFTIGKDQSPPNPILSSNESNQIALPNVWASETSPGSPTYSSNSTQTYTDSPRSPLRLDQIEITGQVDGDFKIIQFDTSEPQKSKPSDKSSPKKQAR